MPAAPTVPVAWLLPRSAALVTVALLGMLAAGCTPPRPAEPEPPLAGWMAAPDRADAFRNFERYYPTRRIAPDLPRALPTGEPMGEVRYTFDGKPKTLADFTTDNHTTGLLVLYRGAIVHEWYAPGGDATSRFTSFSMAKSVTATLVGFALGDGLIGSVDDKLVKYLPELEGSAYAPATIRNVLTMTSGVAFSEEYTGTTSDLADFVVNGIDAGKANAWLAGRKVRVAGTGARFNYNTSETQVLGWLLERVTGEHPADYLSRKLWGPVGMEAEATWVTDRDGGSAVTGMGIQARLRDWARFGQLMSSYGFLHGRELLPPGFVRDATTPTFVATGYGKLAEGEPYGYGYQWWLLPDGRFEAQGIHGQFLLVDPGFDLIVVKTSAWPVAWDTRLEREFHAAVDAMKVRLRIFD